MIHDQTIKTAKAFLFGSTSIPGPKSSKLWQKNAFPAKQEFGLNLVQLYCKPFRNIENKLNKNTNYQLIGRGHILKSFSKLGF